MEIKSKFDHFNINVTNLERSIAFYEKALGLKEDHRKEAADGSFTLVYLTDGCSPFLLELTYLKTIPNPTNWVKTKVICASVSTVITMLSTSITKRMVGYASRTKPWVCTSSTTPMTTGLKFCLPDNPHSSPVNNKTYEYRRSYDGRYRL